MSEKELLSLPLCAIDLRLTSTHLRAPLLAFYEELKAKKIPFKPHFWVSNEWFCPDGIAGIALPFYLLHPKLIALEKKFIGHAEGALPSEFAMLLRHEAGHAIDNAFDLKTLPRRVELFGDSYTRYPTSYRPRPYSRHYVNYLGNGYAQSHPDEDWAETFATWLDPKSRWKSKYFGRPCMEKLEYLDQLMRSLPKKRLSTQKRQSLDSIEHLEMSVGQYLKSKKVRLRIRASNSLDYRITKKIMAPFRDEIRQVLKQRTRKYTYEVDWLLNDFLQNNNNQKKIKLLQINKQLKMKDIINDLESHIIKVESQGGYRIYM